MTVKEMQEKLRDLDEPQTDQGKEFLDRLLQILDEYEENQEIDQEISHAMRISIIEQVTSLVNSTAAFTAMVTRLESLYDFVLSKGIAVEMFTNSLNDPEDDLREAVVSTAKDTGLTPYTVHQLLVAFMRLRMLL